MTDRAQDLVTRLDAIWVERNMSGLAGLKTVLEASGALPYKDTIEKAVEALEALPEVMTMLVHLSEEIELLHHDAAGESI